MACPSSASDSLLSRYNRLIQLQHWFDRRRSHLPFFLRYRLLLPELFLLCLELLGPLHLPLPPSGRLPSSSAFARSLLFFLIYRLVLLTFFVMTSVLLLWLFLISLHFCDSYSELQLFEDISSHLGPLPLLAQQAPLDHLGLWNVELGSLRPDCVVILS